MSALHRILTDACEFLPGGCFEPDGWGFGIITDRGHDYGVFAYYWMRNFMWRRPERPSASDAMNCRRSPYWRGSITKGMIEYLQIERLGNAPEALGAPRTPDEGFNGIRFSLDAFNSWMDEKFKYPPISGADMFPEEPDQRPISGER